MSNPPLPSKSAAPRGVFVLIKLVAAHNKKRWGRALLGVLGIAASVCLIAWVIRAYDAAAHGAPDPAGEAGRFDIVAAPPMPRMMPGSPRDKGGRRSSSIRASWSSFAPIRRWPVWPRTCAPGSAS